MTFDVTMLKPMLGMSVSDNPRIWGYTTPDPITDLDAAGYFNNAANALQVHDQIWCTCDNDLATIVPGIFYVRTIAAGVVTVRRLADL